MTNKQIHNTLRFHRKAAGLRQLDVARLIGLEGSTERISLWENGQSLPSIQNLFKLSQLYKTFPHELYADLYENPDIGSQEGEPLSNQ